MSERGRFAAVSAAAGLGTGLAIIAGFAARTALAITRHGGWHDAKQFLGIGRQDWYTTWTR